MSKKANPTVIGIFVLGALVLAVAGVVFIGSIQFLSQKETFILYFDESVNGLEVGAPVKFKGVPIGQATDIRIRWNQDEDSDHVPVFIEIDVSRLMSRLGVDVDLTDEEVYNAQVNAGLRANLVLESLITGLLYIELDYKIDLGRPLFVQDEVIYKEIPTTPSAMAEIGQSATEIIARLSSIDVEAINDKLIALLDSVKEAIDDVRFAEISDDIIEAVDSITTMAKSEKIGETVDNLNEALVEFRRLAGKVESKIDPVLESADETNKKLQLALEKVSDTVDQLRYAFEPESSFRHEIETALTELAEAAESARMLVEFLERNPKALLTGKSLPEVLEEK